jgi:hypothetical protein
MSAAQGPMSTLAPSHRASNRTSPQIKLLYFSVFSLSLYVFVVILSLSLSLFVI